MYEIYRFKPYGNDATETLVASPKEDGLQILSGETDLTVNEAGSLKFKIPPTHTYYGTFQKLSDFIRLRIDEWKDIFFRVVKIDRDFRNNETITCEGLLAMLNDWICLPYYVDVENDEVKFSYFSGYVGSRALTLKNIIGTVLYNGPSMQSPILMRVSPAISVTEPTNKAELADMSGGGERVLDAVRKIIDRFGGYVYVRAVILGSTPEIDFSFSQDSPGGKTCTQTIEYGKNLMDITVHDNVDGIYTSCIGLGENVTDAVEENMWGDAGRQSSEGYLGTNRFYVDYSNVLIQKYGRRVIYKVFDGLTSSYQVYLAAKRYIKQLVEEKMTFEIKAIDLRSIDTTQDGFCCGDLVPIKSTPHGIDGTYLCTQAHIDLCDLSKTHYSFGGKLTKLSSMVGRK